MALPWSRRTRSARLKKSRAAFGSPTKSFTPASCRTTIVRPGEAVAIATGGMMPRGADAVVMVEHADVVVPVAATSPAQPARDGPAHFESDARSPPAAASRSLAPTSRQARPCCGAGDPDQPRHRRARRDWRRHGRCLAQADRRHPLDRRRDHRARAADAAGAHLRLERAGARRRRSRAWRRAASPRHHAGRCGRAAGEAA